MVQHKNLLRLVFLGFILLSSFSSSKGEYYNTLPSSFAKSQTFLENKMDGTLVSTDFKPPMVKTESLTTTPPEEPYITNVLPGGSFNEYDQNGYLTDFSSSGTAYSYRNNSYRDDVANGTYAYLLEAQGATTFETYVGASVSNFTPIMPKPAENLTFDMWLKIDNPDLAKDSYIYFELSFYNGTYYTFAYYLSYGLDRTPYSGWNSTTYHYLLSNQSTGGWRHFQRNITSDVEELLNYADPGLNLTSISFDVYASYQPVGITRLIVDDLRVYNGTGHNFVLNGDLETGDGSGWSGDYRSSDAEVRLTTLDKTEGNAALNMSVKRVPTGSSSGNAQVDQRFYNPQQGFYPSDPGSLQVEFDWKYSDTAGGGSNQFAYFYMRFRNESSWSYIYCYLGRDRDFNFQTNSTYYTYMNASGFGVRDSWQHQIIDPIAILEEKNISNVYLYSVEFHIYLGNELNSSVQLLIDDFQLKTYPTGDPGFEEDYYPPSLYTPLTSWYRNSGEYPNVSQSSDAHTGDWSLNLTADDFDQGVYRSVGLFLDPGTYIDFWWKTLTTTAVSGAYLELAINDNYYLYYVVTDNGGSYSNSTNNFYFHLDNSTYPFSTWYNAHRNVWNDLISYLPFLAESDLEITYIYLYADIQGSSGAISVLFDDVYFYQDTHGPEIHSVISSPLPNYYDPVRIQVNATDALVGVENVSIYYQNASTWHFVQTTLIGGYYTGFIPPSEYNTTVNFYITAFDRSFSETTDDNGGNYYTYTIGDHINPYVDIISLHLVNDSFVFISAEASDTGSDIEKIEIYDDTTLLSSSNTSLIEYYWNIESVSPTTHSINATAYDKAGNEATDSQVITLFPDDIPPSLSVNGPSSSEPLMGDVQFTIDGSDADSGINELEVLVDGEVVRTDTNLPSSYLWDTTTVSNGNHTITFKLSDNAGNSAETKMDYEVYNPTGFNALAFDFNQLMESNGFIIGAGSIIGLYVIAKLIPWRRKKG